MESRANIDYPLLRFGDRYNDRPFEKKLFYFSKGFERENTGAKEYKIKNAQTMITVVIILPTLPSFGCVKG